MYLLKKINDEWYFGKNRRGCEGMFPSGYIDVKVPIRDVVSVAVPSAKINANNSKDTIPSSSSQQNRIARALYDFNAETSEDLTLKVRHESIPLHNLYDNFRSFVVGKRSGIGSLCHQ